MDKKRISQKIDFKMKNSNIIQINPELRLSHPITKNINIFEEEDEIFSKETINSIYGENYDSIKLKISNIENETINYLSDTISSLQLKYKEFNDDITNHFKNLTYKITDAFKLNKFSPDEIKGTKKEKRANLIQKYSNVYIQELEKIIKIHTQIFNNIKKSISIFYDFLDISKYFTKEKPSNEFFSKELKNIVNNWLYFEIDFSNFDFTKVINGLNLEPDLKELMIKIRKNNNFIMNISNSFKDMKSMRKKYGRLKLDKDLNLSQLFKKNKKILNDNYANLVKLKLKNEFNVDNYFDPKLTYSNIKYLKFDYVTFTSNDQIKNNYLKNMPELEKLIINRANNFEISLLKDLSKSLIKLSLTKNGFVDYEFNNIMSQYLANSVSIRKNLQYLSFSDNYLCDVNLSQIIHTPKQTFYALKELDFQNNKIFQFSIDPEYFSELKCINCCYNNLTINNFDQYEKILTLLSGNIFLSEEDLAKKYFNSLADKLKNYTISLTYLNLSFIPQILSNNYLANIIINDSILINLKKLDISYNNIVCDTIIKFLNNNKGCLSIKSLNLSNNFLDSSFFDKFLENGLNNHFNKLKYIYLDANRLGNLEDLDNSQERKNEECINISRLLYKFIEQNKNLVELSITKNPIGKNILIKNIEENVNNFNYNDYIERDKDGKIEIKCFFSLLWKISIEMNGENKKNKSEIRSVFNLKFDCANSFNINSEEFEFNNNYITFVNQD